MQKLVKKKYTEYGETVIKRKRAIRLLRKKGIFHKDTKELSTLLNKEIFDLYFKTFGEEITRDSRARRKSIITGHIYIIGNLEQGICKIGYSANVEERIKGIQTGCPYPLTVFKVYDGNIPIEKELHKKYKEYRISGEWFKIEGKLKEIILN